MRKSIFSRMMLYLVLFFMAFMGLSFYILTSYFEVYYTQRRVDDMEMRIHQVVELYNQSGVTEELENLINNYDEEGMVIEIIKETSESRSNFILSEPILVGSAGSNPLLGLDKSYLEANNHGSESGSGNQHNGSESETGIQQEGTGSGSGSGNGSGTGDPTQSPGYENGEHLHLTFEEQISEYESGESFITLVESENQQIEWLTYKEIANDGAQVTGRIPLYSVNEVIEVVQEFRMVFFLLVFVLLLIFSYFFARGISKPIVQLNKIAKSMGELNFENKYHGKRKDEVGQLGETLNQISEKLESSIEDLKRELNKERTLEKMRKRFTAYVSHEIQTPLAIIKSYAEALEDEIPQSREEEFEYYQLIQEETDKISGIASDLLDLSQMEAGVYRIKKEKTAAAELMEKVVTPFIKTDSSLNLKLQNDYQEMVLVDQKRIEQVLNNLIGNAIKHHEPDEGRIEIVSQRFDEWWRVTVYNDGNNIPEAETEEIFKYFYTAQSNKKGTGLGLAIVKGIIDCHEGKIRAINKEKGVLFQVDLPIEEI